MKDPGATIAVVGATGAVGREMRAILETVSWPIGQVRWMASQRSAGSSLPFRGAPVEVEDLETASFEGVDFALFSAGSSVSRVHGPRAVSEGAVVIDNTSAFRMEPDVPLVVPEVNLHHIEEHHRLIANPNCSTIQMVLALAPLHRAAGLQRVIVSTYQSSSGAGQKGMEELLAGARQFLAGGPEPEPSVFAHPLAFDVLPHIDVFEPNGYTREELKMVHETRKIMALPQLQVSATCVRVPVLRAHSEAVSLDFEEPLPASRARDILANAPGVEVFDDPATNQYPLARLAEGADATYVGRIRNDVCRESTLHLWIVSDNLRKGAALNAVQIASAMLERKN